MNGSGYGRLRTEVKTLAHTSSDVEMVPAVDNMRPVIVSAFVLNGLASTGTDDQLRTGTGNRALWNGVVVSASLLSAQLFNLVGDKGESIVFNADSASGGFLYITYTYGYEQA